MPIVLGFENCQYTQLTTAGTSTVVTNITPPTSPNALYGVSCVVFGTAPIVNCYDLVGTQTIQLMQGTYTAVGQTITPASGNRGVRLRGSLLVVNTGTASTLNVLWD